MTLHEGHAADVTVPGVPAGAVLEFGASPATAALWQAGAGVVADGGLSWRLAAADVAELAAVGARHVRVRDGETLLWAGSISWFSSWSPSCPCETCRG